MPKQRRTGLFSATINASNMKDLMTFGLRNPTMISLKVMEYLWSRMKLYLKNFILRYFRFPPVTLRQARKLIWYQRRLKMSISWPKIEWRK
jgi:hypothetical protein